MLTRKMPLRVAVLWVLAGGLLGSETQPAGESTATIDAHVGELIGELGADEYSTRERAQAALHRYGLAAFDALYDAMQHDDIEIARRARYLVRSMPIRWALDSDSPEVRNVLNSYGERPVIDRRSRLGRLSLLPEAQGLIPLCRLARFETDNVLSKHAAILVMSYSFFDENARATYSARIRETVGGSKRTAAAWLRTYAETLVDPGATFSAWDRHIREEVATLAQFPERTDPQVVRDLMRWQADFLRRSGREEQAIAVVRRSLDLLPGEREDLVETVNWLLDRKLWTLVEELAQRHGNQFDDDLELLYSLAEAQRKQGREELAQQTAEHARALVATSYLHVRQAIHLQERGLLDWAEMEYRRVLEIAPLGDSFDLQARQRASEMLHDLQRDLPAAELLQQVADAASKDPNVAKLVAQNVTDMQIWLARMHYFYGMHYARLGDSAKEREHLDKAVDEYPLELDALIGMYRVADADDAWREKAKQRIKAAQDQLKEQIRQYEKSLEQPLNEAALTNTKGELAQKYNELAWLVSNTAGDYQEAVRASHKSLELVPGSAAFLDTLGRCYYAAKDYRNAIRYQEQALKLEPYSQQMQRQLQLFQQAQDEAQGEAQKP